MTANSYFIYSQENIRTGLYFHSFEVDKDKRTGLNLTPGKSLHLPEGFTMEFEMKLREEAQNYGYIFRIIGNKSHNIDLIGYQFNPESLFTLVLQKETLINYNANELTGSLGSSWIKCSIHLDVSSNKINLSINNIKKSIAYNLQDMSDFDIYFGRIENTNFHTTDVHPITLRDIKIYDPAQKLIRHWELGKHQNSLVYDICKKDKAIAINPSWMIDKHVKWNKEKTFNLSGQYYQYAFDKVRQRIFIVRDNQVIIYHALTGKSDTIHAKNGSRFNMRPNQMVYDEIKDELLIYDYGKNYLSRFSMKEQDWVTDIHSSYGTNFWHHGRHYSSADSTLIIFGGYGYHKYNSLLQKYNAKDRQWETTDLSKDIPPRYLGSMGFIDDHRFLYFGGYGSETGIQQESPQNYYDLYEIDILDNSVKKIWEIPAVNEHFTNGNSMIVDSVKKVFYILSYPNNKYAGNITLNEYSMESSEHRQLGDSIPYLFNDIDSYCDLYLSEDKNNLYTLVSVKKEDDSEITLYSMAYPPLSKNEITQSNTVGETFKWYYILLGVFIVAIVSLILLKLRKKSSKKPAGPNNIQNTIIPDADYNNINRASSIHLLGDFKVTGKENKDESDNFSPTMRQVFILILLATLSDGSISSDELKKQLWKDKDEVNARNNRNVYINKIRTILKNIGNAEIVNRKGYWSLNIGKDIYCDYIRISALIENAANNNIQQSLLHELIGISSQGTLLPHMEADWLDAYKADFSNRIIETFVTLSQRPAYQSDFALLLKMSDIILMHDNTDEYGIKLKCYSLLNLKRNLQARQAFEKFADDYEKLLAAKPEFTFEDILKFKPI
ncbi:hypothetical protein [Prevotella sp. 10(H)]|uniref:hypothetical protein n=1 Tax=Prevotella sp. 10(H) TaxID=1158294 RepID=UPI0004A73DBE|nr:hypothetical protein [Prevotella sp. 10(H)]